MGVSINGGTQQPSVFLLKMIILGCFWGTTIFGNTHIDHWCRETHESTCQRSFPSHSTRRTSRCHRVPPCKMCWMFGLLGVFSHPFEKYATVKLDHLPTKSAVKIKNIWNHHHFNRVFHCKPSILGYHYFWKHLFKCIMFLQTCLTWHVSVNIE